MTDAAKQIDHEQETHVQSESVAIDAPEIPELVVDDMETLFDHETPLEAVEEINVEAEAIDTDPDEVQSNAEPSSSDTDAVILELTQTIENLKAQLEDRNSQYMRIAADFDNFRRRTLKEKEELEEKIKCNTISELLPVIDNFERARLQLKPQTDAETNIHKSYQGVYKQMVDCLKRVGVSPMRAEGKTFDPSFHEAVAREATDQHDEGTVLEELVRGYLLGERVLRHALVKVAVPLEDVDSSPSEAGEAE